MTTRHTFSMDEEDDAPVVQPGAPAAIAVEVDEPIDALKKQFSELERERQARQQAEAQLQRYAVERDRTTLERAFADEERNLGEQKRKYAAALNDMDHDTAAEVQAEMIKTNAVMTDLARQYHEHERKTAAPVATSDDAFEVALKSMHPAVAAWARSHRSDLSDPNTQKLAYAADSFAIAKGLEIGSDQYLDFLDTHLGFGYSDEPAPAPAPKPRSPGSGRRTPSAPPSRTSSSGGGGRTKVFLTEDDKRQAQNYGVSLQEYASWKVAAEKNSRNGGDEASGFHRNKMLSYKAVSS